MDSADKRRHARAAIRGVARLATGATESSELLAVRDLSPGGLGLTGAGHAELGARVELELRLFGESLTVAGRVAWIAEGTHPGLGVALARTPAMADLLGDIEERMAARQPRGCALLVEADPSRAALLAEYLWSHGYDVEEVAAPLSAIDRLALGDVELVAIGPHLSTCSGGEFAAFVAESFPRVHRLVVACTGRGTGAHTVAAAFEPERPITAIHAVVCDDERPRRRW
jgi:CheY-like chemotaxis protein